MALIKHVATGELYAMNSYMMGQIGKGYELVGDDGNPIVEESPVAAALKTEAPKRGKGKAILIEGEE